MHGYIKEIRQSKLATQWRATRKALKNGKIQTRGKRGRCKSENEKQGSHLFFLEVSWSDSY